MNIAAVMVQSLVFVSRHGHVLFFLNGEFVHFFGRHFFSNHDSCCVASGFQSGKTVRVRFLFLVLRKGIVVNGLVLFQRDGRVWLGGWRNIEKKTDERAEETHRYIRG